MPFIPGNNVAEVELVFSTPGGTAENTLYFSNNTEEWDETNLVALAQTVSAWWAAHYQLHQSNSVALREIKATSLETQFSPGIVYTFGMPDAGSLTSPILPGNVTCAVTFRTLLRGRSFRGRNYWVGLTEEQVAGDQLVSGMAAQLAYDYETLIAEATADGFTWGVFSRYQGGVARVTGEFTPITATSCDGIIDSQRRRLLGRGA